MVGLCSFCLQKCGCTIHCYCSSERTISLPTPGLSSAVRLSICWTPICIHLSVVICVSCWSLCPLGNVSVIGVVWVFVISTCKMTSHSYASWEDKDNLSQLRGLFNHLTFFYFAESGRKFSLELLWKGGGTNIFCLWALGTIWNTHEIRFLSLSLPTMRLLFQVCEVPVGFMFNTWFSLCLTAWSFILWGMCFQYHRRFLYTQSNESLQTAQLV